MAPSQRKLDAPISMKILMMSPHELIDSEEEPIVVSAKAGSNRRGSDHPDFILSDCLSDTDEDEDGNVDFWAYATPALSARIASPISF